MKVTVFIWAGSWGPFRIRSHCEECDINYGIVRSAVENELSDLDISLEKKPWLDNWWFCLKKGAWHAPIIIVDGRLYSQFSHTRPIINKQDFIEFIRK